MEEFKSSTTSSKEVSVESPFKANSMCSFALPMFSTCLFDVKIKEETELPPESFFVIRFLRALMFFPCNAEI